MAFRSVWTMCSWPTTSSKVRGRLRRYSDSMGRPILAPGSVEQIERRTHHRLRVDLVVAVDVVEVTGLAELGHPEAAHGHPVNAAEEGERMRVPVEYGHERRRALGGKELLEHPVAELPEAAPRPKRAEQQVRARDADHVGRALQLVR